MKNSTYHITEKQLQKNYKSLNKEDNWNIKMWNIIEKLILKLEGERKNYWIGDNRKYWKFKNQRIKMKK